MALPQQPRVVVTGAGSGLGRAFCNQLARRPGGVRLVASDVSLAGVEATVAALGADGQRVTAVALRCDVAKAEDVEALAVAAEERFGGVDLVINNAGVAVAGRVGEIPLADWQWLLGVNLWGVVHGCHAFVPRMRRQGSGHVLNVASAAGLVSMPEMAPYNVAKAAVVALSETLHGELAGTGVGVSVLCPTFFRTNITRDSRGGDPAKLKLAEALMARSRLSAEDVAAVALAGVEADRLYVLPHGDGRWMWRLKRLAPESFHDLLPRAVAWSSRRLARD